MILDGGSCTVGVESTIVEVLDNVVTVLRPGAVTEEMLAEVAPYVTTDTHLVTGKGVPKAPGTCPLVIVSDVAAATDTGRFAHIRFPALAWGEKSGTVTNSERRISRQRAFMAPPGEARADWWIVARVAQALGFGSAFAWQHPHEVFSEHAALSFG